MSGYRPSHTSVFSATLGSQIRLNGMVDGQPAMKKRRGRRKNVEGMDLLFMNKNRPSVMPDQVRQLTSSTLNRRCPSSQMSDHFCYGVICWFLEAWSGSDKNSGAKTKRCCLNSAGLFSINDLNPLTPCSGFSSVEWARGPQYEPWLLSAHGHGEQSSRNKSQGRNAAGR